MTDVIEVGSFIFIKQPNGEYMTKDSEFTYYPDTDIIHWNHGVRKRSGRYPWPKEGKNE